jgi:hypothetical protein
MNRLSTHMRPTFRPEDRSRWHGVSLGHRQKAEVQPRVGAQGRSNVLGVARSHLHERVRRPRLVLSIPASTPSAFIGWSRRSAYRGITVLRTERGRVLRGTTTILCTDRINSGRILFILLGPAGR